MNIEEAKQVLSDYFISQMRVTVAIDTPDLAKQLLITKLAGLSHEVFVVIFFDAQHRLIKIEEMFRGTLTQTSVYPREIVKEAIYANAASVIFGHNHPSGVAEPSRADEHLTTKLKQALDLVGVVVLDHIVVAGNTSISFAERGLL